MKRLKSKYIIILFSFIFLFTFMACGKQSKVDEIKQRGYILIGTTGDYRPISYLDASKNEYWGFDIEFSQIIADSLGVEVKFIQTSWPTLTEDTQKEDGYDMAISGISITNARKETMLMSDGYLKNGKTILCRAEDVEKYKSLEDIDQVGVKVMVNPGGLNEKFAQEQLKNAEIIVHEHNEEIPTLIAEKEADIMITEILEAPYYVETDERLAAPLIEEPFTNGEVGVLMRKGDEELCEKVNEIIKECKQDGRLDELYEKYGFINKG